MVAAKRLSLQKRLRILCLDTVILSSVACAGVLVIGLAGRATLWGPILGAFILELGQQYFAYELGGSQYYLIAYASIFLIVMLLMPRGILPSVHDRLRRKRRR